MNIPSSIDQNEVEKFSALAAEWWDESGKFKPLHIINPTRITYIRKMVIEHFNIAKDAALPFTGFNLLDIGCGGGLLAEPMSRLGANVTAIDASEKNIKTAAMHSSQVGLEIDYRCISIEELAATNAKFDIVLNMEVIEHVADVESFMAAASKVLAPNGVIFIATLNRTIKSYLLAILGAEYILGWLPKGTHDWKKFLTPAELAYYLRKNSLAIKEMKGMEYNLLSGNWFLSDNLDVNYIICANYCNQ